MDQSRVANMVEIKVEMLDGGCMTFNIGQTWTFLDLRMELSFYMPTVEESANFSFTIIMDTNSEWRNKKGVSELFVKFH